ncbi:MAG: PDZ domain-containing protein, partial [Rhizobacter sp.]|nr:PDZ domain-containing protein [Chlorobiales bacterium]
MGIKITEIHAGGLADELGLRVGDEIAEINGDKVADIIDYRFFISDEQIKLGFFRDMK